MKRNFFNHLVVSVLAVGMLFTSCSKDEEEEGIVFPNAPETVTASVVEDHPNWVQIEWSEVKDAFGFHLYRAEAIDGDYEKMVFATIVGHKATDKSADYNKTYFYKVVAYDIYFEQGTMSEPVEITTGEADLTPRLTVRSNSTGEGYEAVLNHIKIQWNVSTSEGVDEYKVMRDGVEIKTQYSSGILSEFSYDDVNVSYDVEYSYQVIAVAEDGTEFASEVEAYTATRPEVIDRPAPVVAYIEGVSGEQRIRVGVTRVEGDSETTQYEIRSRIDGYADWISVEGMVSDFETDDSGNITTTFGYGDLTFTTAGVYFDAQARVFTAGQWSEWSSTETAFIMVGK
jgi:hypothetical protein